MTDTIFTYVTSSLTDINPDLVTVQLSITSSGIGTVSNVTRTGDAIKVIFTNALTAPQVTILNNIMTTQMFPPQPQHEYFDLSLYILDDTSNTDFAGFPSIRTDGGMYISKDLVVNSTINSTSVSSGSLQIRGGAGIIGNLYAGNVYSENDLIVGGIASISNTTASSSPTTGALVIGGGVGISGTVYGNNFYGATFYSNGTQLATVAQLPVYTAGLNMVLSGVNAFSVSNAPTFSGVVSIVNTTVSTSVSTGALQVLGGLGVDGDIYAATFYSNGSQLATVAQLPVYTAGSNLVLSGTSFSVLNAPTFSGVVSIVNTSVSNSTSTGSLVLSGGLGVSGQITSNTIVASSITGFIQTATQTNITTLGTLTELTSSGIVLVVNTTVSTSKTSGALVISGGLGISGSIYGSSIYSNGSLLTTYTAGTNIVLTGTSFSVLNAPTFSGIVSIVNTSVSNSTNTGSLVLSGGLGVSGQITSNAIVASSITGFLQTATQTNVTSLGTLTGLTSSGIVSVINTAVSTSKTSGALVVSGGLGISGSIYGSSIYSNGSLLTTYTAGSNLVLSGSTFSVINAPTFS